MKTLLLLIALITPLYAKTEKELLALAKLEHSRERLIPELKIYPDAREYNLKYKILFPENAPALKNETTHEKIVKGKYLIAEMSLGEGANKMDILMVLTYSRTLKSYQKWVLNKNTSELSEFVGVRLPNTRTVSWMMIETNAKNPMQHLSVETNTDNGGSWLENYYKDGKLMLSISGSAIKVK